MSTPEHPEFDLYAGTTELYRDPMYYDHEYKHRTEDVEFYVAHYLEVGDVLELGVGSGRVAARAVRKGAKVLGIDMSPEMLGFAEARRERLPKARQADLQLVQGDMRAFHFGRTFELIGCPFNAFQHLYTREDIEACLGCVRDHLEPGGRFVVDVLMPDMDYLMRPPTKWYAGTHFKHPRYDAWYTYTERSDWDAVTQINQMWFRSMRDPREKDGPEEIVVQLSHRYFWPQELVALLHYNGFEVESLAGDFEGTALRTDSESIVVVARRR